MADVRRGRTIPATEWAFRIRIRRWRAGSVREISTATPDPTALQGMAASSMEAVSMQARLALPSRTEVSLALKQMEADGATSMATTGLPQPVPRVPTGRLRRVMAADPRRRATGLRITARVTPRKAIGRVRVRATAGIAPLRVTAAHLRIAGRTRLRTQHRDPTPWRGPASRLRAPPVGDSPAGMPGSLVEDMRDSPVVARMRVAEATAGKTLDRGRRQKAIVCPTPTCVRHVRGC